MITYHAIPGFHDINVKLDGKIVGRIIRQSKCTATGAEYIGWAYRPKNGSYGETFPTLEACKRSLES